MLDIHVAGLVAHVRESGAPDLADLPVDGARAMYRQILAAGGPGPADIEVERLGCDGPAGTVALRLYRPRGAAGGLVVWYHGGGYVMGDLDGYDGVCRQLCADSGCLVLAVEYRLAPEHAYPAAFEDAWAALRWAADRARALGVDPRRLAVAGDSAGAVIATAVAMRARDASRRGEAGAPQVAFQALLYPPAAGGHDGAFPSRLAHAAGPTLTQRTSDYFLQHAFGEHGRAADWRGAPLQAATLAGLPPALVQVAGHDPLRDEALAYGEALLAAGTPVSLVEYPGLPHGYVSMGPISPAARLAQRQLGDALRLALEA